MKKFSDLRVGDEIYVIFPTNYINPYTILEISNSSSNLIFILNDFIILIKEEDINKSISIPEFYHKLIITDLKIADWFIT